jgi:uncharacterized repeat protein (TIGR03803 family)
MTDPDTLQTQGLARRRATFGLSLFLLPAAAHGASLTPVYYFAANSHGAYPHGEAPLDEVIEAPDGSFYTTTEQGGANTKACAAAGFTRGCGTVVQITGKSEKVIFNFPAPAVGGTNGAAPIGGLVQGPDGALYGTTSAGPTPEDYGTVFKLQLSGGTWTMRTLHVFTGYNTCIAPVDGAVPLGRLVFAPDGFLYGTTSSGGCVVSEGPPHGNEGTLFRIASDGSAYQTLYNLDGYHTPTDPAVPYAGLTADPGGLLYGTSYFGGAADGGTVFSYTPSTGTLTLMHSFSGLTPDGGAPYGALTRGTDGLLWGTTFSSTNGGDPTYNGTVFNISPQTPFALKSFVFPGPPGGSYSQPRAGVIQASDGKFYGTTGNGALYSMTQAGTLADLGIFPTTLAMTDPVSVPLQGADGRIYGTTSDGGPVTHGLSDVGDVWVYAGGLKKPKPSVNWFLPASGAVGSSVVIAGTNFIGTTAVTFQGTTASSLFAVDASGFITATVPTGAETGPVTITTPAGAVASSISFNVP